MLSFKKKPYWKLQWSKLPGLGIMETIGFIVLVALIYGTCRNKESPRLTGEETAIEYQAPSETVSIVRVIDVKSGQNLDGSPTFYLAMQQTEPKMNGFVFIAEASPTEAYKYMGERLQVHVQNDTTIKTRPFVPAKDWYIDSVFSPTYLYENE